MLEETPHRGCRVRMHMCMCACCQRRAVLGKYGKGYAQGQASLRQQHRASEKDRAEAASRQSGSANVWRREVIGRAAR